LFCDWEQGLEGLDDWTEERSAEFGEEIFK
jgi:hypothetical protein